MASSPAHILTAGLRWVSVDGGPLPAGAIQGGYSGSKKESPFYIGRVLAPDGKYYPGKGAFWQGKTRTRYCYDNKETISYQCEILCLSDDSVVEVTWVKASNGKTPAYAVQGERNEKYIGRHEAEADLIVGEVNTELGECIVVTNNTVYRFKEYEVCCAFPHTSTAIQ